LQLCETHRVFGRPILLVFIGVLTGSAANDLSVSNWFALPPPTVLHRLNMRVAPASEEQITVTSHRREAPRQAPVTGYEANSSAAAQRMYAPSPVWASAEQQRLMSHVKDALAGC
jgi:hypothetical protein